MRRPGLRATCMSAACGILLAGCSVAPLAPAPPEAYAGFTPDGFARHVQYLADPKKGGRMAGTPGHDAAAEYLADQFKQAGLHPSGDDGTWYQNFKARYGSELADRNVIGVLPASSGDDSPTIVVSAHYDHLPSRMNSAGEVEVFPGADDNTSGVSAMVLIARAMACTPQRFCTFVFIGFSSEEIGFQGSKHYVQHPVRPLERTALLVNMDQIGYVRNEQLLMIGSLLNPTIFRAMERIGREQKDGLRLTPVPGKSSRHWSDQAPFSRVGLPTLFIYCGQTRYYHTPQDTPDRINNDGGARTARLVFEMLRALDYEYGQTPTPRIGMREMKGV